MKNSISFILLFQFTLGILSPVATIFKTSDIEENIVLMNSEIDHEMEEEELEETVILFSISEKELVKNSTSLSSYWKQNPYQYIGLYLFWTPPKTMI